MVDDDKKRKMSQDDDQMKCEHCEEVFGTMEDLKKHINHQHYRDTYKSLHRARRIWAQTCLSRSTVLVEKEMIVCKDVKHTTVQPELFLLG